MADNIYPTFHYTCNSYEARVPRGDLPVTFINQPHMAGGFTDLNVTRLSFDIRERPFQLTYLTRDVVQRFSNLQLFIISANLTSINQDAFEVCNIEILDIFSNPDLTEFPNLVLKNCVRMINLRLSHNNIRSVNGQSFVGLDNLQTLQIIFNQNITIPEDTFRPLSNLRRLDLINLAITEINPGWFIGLSRLESLNFDTNLISSISSETFENLPNLIILTISSNPINRLNSFGSMPSLQNVFASWCRLNEIEPNFFEELPNIHTFDGRSNLCIREIVTEVRGIDFQRENAFTNCFNNFLGITTTTTTTTQAPPGGGSGKIEVSVLLVFIGVFYGLM